LVVRKIHFPSAASTGVTAPKSDKVAAREGDDHATLLNAKTAAANKRS